MQAAPSPAPRSQSASSRYLRVLVACALALCTAQVGLLVLGNLADHMVGTLLLMGFSFGVLLVAGRQPRAPSWVFVLGVAALLRILSLPLVPTLSDDALRYVWDGRVVAAGENPYRFAPDAPELAPLRDEMWARLNHREVPTVYPPLALGFFSIAAQLPKPILAWKLMLALIDLGTCGLLLSIALKTGLSVLRVIWYAWNPLVVLEVAGMGHVDALGVAAVVAALWYLITDRSGSVSGGRSRSPASRKAVLAGVFAVAGILAKLVPVVAVPLWSRFASGRCGHSGRTSWLFLGVVVGVLIVTTIPIVWAVGGAPPGLTTYGVSWEFNGPIYEPLWRAIDGLHLDQLLHAGLDRFKGVTGWHDALNRVYPYAYPQFLAKLALLGLLVGVVAVSWWHRGFCSNERRLEATAWVLGTALLCSATFYPWYLLWVLPFAALTGHRAWLTLSATLPLAYLPQFTEVSLFPWVFLVIWLPFAFFYLRSWPFRDLVGHAPFDESR